MSQLKNFLTFSMFGRIRKRIYVVNKLGLFNIYDKNSNFIRITPAFFTDM